MWRETFPHAPGDIEICERSAVQRVAVRRTSACATAHLPGLATGRVGGAVTPSGAQLRARGADAHGIWPAHDEGYGLPWGIGRSDRPNKLRIW